MSSDPQPQNPRPSPAEGPVSLNEARDRISANAELERHALGETVEREQNTKNALNLAPLFTKLTNGTEETRETQIRESLVSTLQKSVVELQAMQTAQEILNKSFLFLKPVNTDPERGPIVFTVNLHGNSSLELGIGMAHFLPANVTKVEVEDMEGNLLSGTRRTDPRPGYYTDEGRYIPVFTGYKIKILRTENSNNEEIKTIIQEEQTYYQSLQEAYSGDQDSTERQNRDIVSYAERLRALDTLDRDPRYQEILSKFTEARISLFPETFLSAKEDMDSLPENVLQMLNRDTLAFFKIAQEGGTRGGAEIGPATNYVIRLRDIPTVNEFAGKMTDANFSTAVFNNLLHEQRETDGRPVAFDYLFGLMEATSSPVFRNGNTNTAGYERLIGQSQKERFVNYVRDTLGINFDAESVMSRETEESDFETWYASFRGPDENYRTFSRLFKAIAYQESGGNYFAVGINSRGDRAIGKYQVMAKMNWKNWSREACGEIIPPTSYNQDKIAFFKMLKIYKKWTRQYPADSDMAVRLTAAEWYGGPGGARAYESGRGTRKQRGNMPSIRDYATSVLGRMNKIG